ncbi:hypothetical protein B0E50_06460 [Rhodanobacter sp. C01]|nr:hypothetical protein B0E50_06460 [Rhodanobacter sp. C01]
MMLHRKQAADTLAHDLRFMDPVVHGARMRTVSPEFTGACRRFHIVPLIHVDRDACALVSMQA